MSISSSIYEQLQEHSEAISFPGFYINGEFHTPKSGETLNSSNPNSEVTLTSTRADKGLYKEAIDHGHKQSRAIAHLTSDQKINLISSFRSLLSDRSKEVECLLRIESGKPKWESCQDLQASLTYLDWITENKGFIFEKIHSPAYLSSHPGKLMVEPVGLTLGYLPFSTPLTSFVLFLTNTIISGCPLVLMASRHTSLLSCILAEICQQTKFPTGAVQILAGDFKFFKVGLNTEKVKAVIYTGSNEHCDTIRRESQTYKGRQLILQSGGKNSILVAEDADLDLALKCVLISAFKASGQQCSSASQIFLHKSIQERFGKKLSKAMTNLRVGATWGEGSENIQMGPLVSTKAVDSFLKYQTMAHREASETLVWGKALDDSNSGCFVTPGLHVIKNFDSNCSYQSNVLFCPDLAIYSFDDYATACEQINDTRFLLSASLMTSEERSQEICRHLRAPNIQVNSPTVEASASLTLSGRRQSSTHRYSGLGISMTLSEPKMIKSAEQYKGLLSSWP